jgi:tetratricopeptide (TPR) repeat protein
LRIDPENDACSINRSVALREIGRTGAALETTRRVLGRNPEDALAHANHGWAWLQLRHFTRARRHFQESLRLDPTSAFARNGLKEARRGDSAFPGTHHPPAGGALTVLGVMVLVGAFLHILRVAAGPLVSPDTGDVLIVLGVSITGGLLAMWQRRERARD